MQRLTRRRGRTKTHEGTGDGQAWANYRPSSLGRPAAGNAALRRWRSVRCSGGSFSFGRQLRNRIGMNARTVNQREFGSLFAEGQRQIGTAKQYRLGVLVRQ